MDKHRAALRGPVIATCVVVGICVGVLGTRNAWKYLAQPAPTTGQPVGSVQAPGDGEGAEASGKSFYDEILDGIVVHVSRAPGAGTPLLVAIEQPLPPAFQPTYFSGFIGMRVAQTEELFAAWIVRLAGGALVTWDIGLASDMALPEIPGSSTWEGRHSLEVAIFGFAESDDGIDPTNARTQPVAMLGERISEWHEVVVDVTRSTAREPLEDRGEQIKSLLDSAVLDLRITRREAALDGLIAGLCGIGDTDALTSLVPMGRIQIYVNEACVGQFEVHKLPFESSIWEEGVWHRVRLNVDDASEVVRLAGKGRARAFLVVTPDLFEQSIGERGKWVGKIEIPTVRMGPGLWP